MLILLPPSEGKTAPTTGPPVDLSKLAYAGTLTPSRQKLLGALAALAELPVERAVSMLAVSAGQAGEVARVLLEAKKPPSDPEGAARIAEAAGFTVELTPGHLDVIVPA